MAIPIRFLTAVLTKEAIAESYPGGLARFLDDHPEVPEDDQLVGVSFMSGGDLQEFLDRLQRDGFDLAQGCAVGEMFHGQWGEPCAGIKFEPNVRDSPMMGWRAIAVPREDGP